MKNKDKVKEENRIISLNPFSSNAKVEDDEDNINKASSKDEEMSLFVRHYNKHIKRKSLKHYDKSLMKFRKSNPSKKLEYNKSEQRQVTCYECRKPEHYKTDCPSLMKRKCKKLMYNLKRNNIKGRKSYITWEEDGYYSSSNTSLNEEIVTLCLMAHHTKKRFRGK